MCRMLLCCAVLAAVPLTSRADQTVTPSETLIQLTVHPMPAPKPALRYLLLPELKEMTPGNPIPNYLKCLMDQDATASTEIIGRAGLRLADKAARMDKPDWQILLKLKTDGISLLLPDVQKLRTLAQALQGRFREEVAQQRFDDALVTAKTMFALSRHMGEHPTLIGDLVGMAIANVTIGPLEEMLQQPGCPNLYWALTQLPSPFISLEKGLEGERILFLSEFPDLNDQAPMSADQIKKLLVHIDRIRDFDDKRDKRRARAILDARMAKTGTVDAARRRLVEAGYPEDRVRSFPPDQVMLLDDRHQYEVYRDEYMKLMILPAWQGEALAKQIKPIKDDPPLFNLFIPAVFKVRRAQARLDQRIALLRHVEALRMYAAEHGGKFPARLTDVSVPLPDDPFTGKPFRYTLDGSTAHLRGSPPPGEDNPVYKVHYEITLQK